MLNEETGELAAVALLTGVHIDAVTRKSCPVPEELRRRAEQFLAPDTGAWNTWPPARSFLT